MCGQLGNKGKKHSFSPVPVELPKGTLLDIACGNLHSVALTTSGNLFIWGYVSDDHLGLSETGEEYQAVPIAVNLPSGGKLTKLYAGGWHTAVVSGKAFENFVSINRNRRSLYMGICL
jgi:alpha-tubulin suppressor-like RCC1 family protein